jgi:cation:H+ antiporter
MTALAWTFPLLLFASIVIGWAAEVTAAHLSAGIALAVLAWLQTAPEFAVEASIAWARDTHLALANLTGSLRLLMGLGWPMVFFVHWFTQRQRGSRIRDVQLPASFSIEAVSLAVPVIYFLIILAKRTWTLADGLILCAFYGAYFWLLYRQRKSGVEEPGGSHDDEPRIVRAVLKLDKRKQYACTVLMFAFGAWALLTCVHPFVDALKAVATSLGVSQFVFIQWVAPIASEFPEKVTAFNWARRPGKAAMAIVNMLSSITSQWTLLAGLVPVIFSLSAGHPFTIELSAFQRAELALTVAQSALAVLFLADLKVRSYEVAGLFVLWLAQFVMPSWREGLIPIYVFWAVLEAAVLVMNPQRLVAWKTLRRIIFPASSGRSASARKAR